VVSGFGFTPSLQRKALQEFQGGFMWMVFDAAEAGVVLDCSFIFLQKSEG
jgi:hypothetical protein